MIRGFPEHPSLSWITPKFLQFFKDLIKSKRKNKSKLKVKWNVTAKQRKKND